MTREQFLEALDELVAAKHLLKHPFYKLWSEGKLTRTNLREYAISYYPQVAAFPRYVSGVHSGCEDSALRQELLENLIEEERGRVARHARGLDGRGPRRPLRLRVADPGDREDEARRPEGLLRHRRGRGDAVLHGSRGGRCLAPAGGERGPGPGRPDRRGAAEGSEDRRPLPRRLEPRLGRRDAGEPAQLLSFPLP